MLVRHGETEGESSIRYHGRNDVALSPLGREQMARVGAALAGQRFDAVFTSRLRRTVEAARIIVPDHAAEAVPEFDEIHFGDWEGLTREEIAARDPDNFARWEADRYGFTYPNGDSVPHFRARVAAAFRARHPHLPARTLAIVHRGIVATLFGELLGLTEASRGGLGIELASIHVLREEPEGWQVEVLNRTDHLEDLR